VFVLIIISIVLFYLSMLHECLILSLHFRIVKLLLAKGANIQERTIDGLNILHLAIRSGSDNPELLKILLDSGADVNGRTLNGDTPLHYAAFMGNKSFQYTINSLNIRICKECNYTH
jgi:ankyrin repeat protein